MAAPMRGEGGVELELYLWGLNARNTELEDAMGDEDGSGSCNKLLLVLTEDPASGTEVKLFKGEGNGGRDMEHSLANICHVISCFTLT